MLGPDIRLRVTYMEEIDMPDEANSAQNPPVRDSETIDRMVTAISRLGERVLSLIGWIVFLTFFVFILLVGGYFYVLLQMPESDIRRSDSLSRIQETMMSVWDRIIPIGSTALRVIAPVIVLMVALAILQILSKKSAQPLDLSKFVNDLPSLIALLIVTAICLLPLSGLVVPEVLNNVALVVVGFYFGKRTTA
jgi:hypothetical protein